MHSVLRESIKSWTAGKAEKSTPLDDIGDAKFYDLTFLRDMAKGTVEAGSHNPQEYTVTLPADDSTILGSAKKWMITEQLFFFLLPFYLVV